MESVLQEHELEIPINTPLSEQLEGFHDLGTDIDEGGFIARVGDQPIGLSVRGLFSQLGTSDLDLTKLYKRFETWLIPHRLAIIRRSGFAEPTSVGVEIEYLNESRTCSVVSLFPSFQYVEHGHIGGHVSFIAKMSASGDLAPMLSGPVTSDKQCTLGALTATANAGGSVGVRLQSTVSTPSISAVGIGSSRCEWRLDKQKEPLFGRDIETWSAVALHKSQRELKYRMRFYFIARTVFVPTRRQSDWVNVTCTLAA